MRERAARAAAPTRAGASRGDASRSRTFHALGLRILRGDARGARPQAALLDPRSRRPRADRRRACRDDRSRPRARRAVADQRSGRTRCVAPARRGEGGAATTTSSRAARAYRALRRRAARLSGGRFRRPDRAAGRAAARTRRRRARKLAGALRASADRRIPGHESRAVPAAAASGRANARRSPRSATTTRRSTAGAARRSTISRSCRSDYPKLKVDQARAELPLDGAHPALGQRADREQSEALRQEAVERARPRRHDPRDARPPTTRPKPRAVVRRLLAHKFEHRGTLRRLRDPLSRQPPGEACSSSSCARRTFRTRSRGGQSLFRPRRDQGPRRLPAPDRQRRRRSGVHPRGDDAEARRRRDDARAPGRIGRRAARACSPPCSPTRRARPLPARQREILDAFCALINGLRYRAEREPAGRLLDELVAAIGYEDTSWRRWTSASRREARWQSVRDFVDWLARKGEADGKNLLELTQTIALITMLEGAGGQASRTRCACPRCTRRRASSSRTCSSSALEEGLLPHREAIAAGNVDEERRLIYVGLTRAQRSLHLSFCRRRKRAGEWQSATPSRFLAELAQEDLRCRRGAPPGGGARKGGGQRAPAAAEGDARALKLSRVRGRDRSRLHKPRAYSPRRCTIPICRSVPRRDRSSSGARAGCGFPCPDRGVRRAAR